MTTHCVFAAWCGLMFGTAPTAQKAASAWQSTVQPAFSLPMPLQRPRTQKTPAHIP
jgi:hypothetical protein